MRVLTKWIICCGAIFLAQAVFPQSAHIYGEIITVVGAGTVLWLINLFIRPIAQLLSIVFTLITFGLFSIVVNTGMVCLADTLVPGIRFDSFWICLFIALVISAGNMLLTPRYEK